MKILVIGATGGSGRAATDELLRRGHAVTAFSRHASTLSGIEGDLTTVDGDATSAADVAAVVPGQDAVVVALGISEPALRVRLRGATDTPDDIRSRGTAVVLRAMRDAGVQDLVVQSAYGVRPTRPLLPLTSRVVFALLLKPQIADTEEQERHVRASATRWTLVQPVNLTDGPAADPRVTTDGSIGAIEVSRESVARVLADAVEGRHGHGRTLSVSG